MREDVHVPRVTPVLGRQTRAFVESCPWPAPPQADGLASREHMAALWNGSGREEPDVEEEWLAVPGRDGDRIRVRILRPAGACEPLPVVLYLHGLGWMLTDAHALDFLPALKHGNSGRTCHAGASPRACARRRWLALHGPPRGEVSTP